MIVDINTFKLTDQEVLALSGVPPHSAGTLLPGGFQHQVLDAQLKKALYGMLAAIDAMDSQASHDFPAGWFIDEATRQFEELGLFKE